MSTFEELFRTAKKVLRLTKTRDHELADKFTHAASRFFRLTEEVRTQKEPPQAYLWVVLALTGRAYIVLFGTIGEIFDAGQELADEILASNGCLKNAELAFEAAILAVQALKGYK